MKRVEKKKSANQFSFFTLYLYCGFLKGERNRKFATASVMWFTGWSFDLKCDWPNFHFYYVILIVKMIVQNTQKLIRLSHICTYTSNRLVWPMYGWIALFFCARKFLGWLDVFFYQWKIFNHSKQWKIVCFIASQLRQATDALFCFVNKAPFRLSVCSYRTFICSK